MIRASSTDMFKRSVEIRKDIKKKMEIRQFEIRKNALVKELYISLSNLSNISSRIASRITKAESEGRTMTEARTLLTTANNKLAEAKVAVAAFESLAPATASSTVEIDLGKPRVVGDAAIKSVKEARDAFQKVVVAIAHAMGLRNASTTNPTAN